MSYLKIERIRFFDKFFNRQKALCELPANFLNQVTTSLLSSQAMHHTMLSMTSAFEDWEWFHKTLHSVSKFFSNWGRLRRFQSVVIERNPMFTSGVLRNSFSRMFKTTCPTLQEQRWEYL